MRIKRGFKARRRRQKVLKLAKGFRGGQANCFGPRQIPSTRPSTMPIGIANSANDSSAGCGLPASMPRRV
jgi:hypothetical protein